MNKETKGTSYELDALVTVAELASRLKVSVKTIRDWVYRKVVPYTKLRGRVYFSVELINDLLNANAISALGGRSVGSPSPAKPVKGGASGNEEVINGT